MIQVFFSFSSPLHGAKGACLCDMPLHGVGTWLARLGKMTEQVAKRRRQGRASACCERTAGVLVVCDGERLKKTVLTHLQRHKKTWLYWRDTAGGPHLTLCICCGVCDCSTQSVFHGGRPLCWCCKAQRCVQL